MNCVLSGIIGLGLLGATASTMTVSEKQHNKLRDLFSPELDKIYNKIALERRNIYFQGLVLGFILSYYLEKCFELTNTFHRITLYLFITMSIAVIYYSLVPKSDYMLNHLKTIEENKAWLEVYKTMKERYVLGFLLSILAVIPLSYSLCKN